MKELIIKVDDPGERVWDGSPKTFEIQELVRCMDCKHSEPWYNDKSRCFLWHETGIDVFNDGFCNYGERKKVGDEMDREKVIKAVEEAFDMYKSEYEGTSYFDEKEWAENKRDALAMLKEQEAMNVDAFVQWCLDSHIMGDATVRGIKYWVEKFKERR